MSENCGGILVYRLHCLYFLHTGAKNAGKNHQKSEAQMLCYFRELLSYSNQNALDIALKDLRYCNARIFHIEGLQCFIYFLILGEEK